MKKHPRPAINPTAFSSAGQYTSPPFSVALESAELRRHLLEEMLHTAGEKTRKPPGKERPRKLKK